MAPVRYFPALAEGYSLSFPAVYLWCRRRDSNPHEVAIKGFKYFLFWRKPFIFNGILHFTVCKKICNDIVRLRR